MRSPVLSEGSVGVEVKLFDSLLAGDETAFEKLCSIHGDHVRSMARTFVARNPSSAHLKDDLVSEGVLAVVAALRFIQSNQDGTTVESLEGYLTTSIRNAFLTLVENEQAIRFPLKKRKALKYELQKVKQTPFDMVDVPAAEPSDLDDLMQGFLSVCVTDQERTLVEMRANGHVDQSIARCLGCSITTVQRMRWRIEERFNERGGN